MKFDKNKLKESLRGVGASTLSIGRNAKRAADSLVKQAQAKWETRSPGLRKACVERTKASEEFAKSTGIKMKEGALGMVDRVVYLKDTHLEWLKGTSGYHPRSAAAAPLPAPLPAPFLARRAL